MNTKDFYPTNFNPSDWLKSENKASSAAAPSSSGVASPTSREDDAARVKALIEALQASHVDLTASYDNWLHVGFALANTFGENGRTFFHEISALSPKYDRKEADSKYSSCLRQGNGAVTIGTLFHLAKEHAVTWPPSSFASASSDATGSVRCVCTHFALGSRLRAALRLNQPDVCFLVRGSQAGAEDEDHA